jgi:hypothetical protein
MRSWRKTSSPRRFRVTVRREGDAEKNVAGRLRCQIESAQSPSPSPPLRAQVSGASYTHGTGSADRLAALVRSLQDIGRKCPDNDDEPLLCPPRRVLVVLCCFAKLQASDATIMTN